MGLHDPREAVPHKLAPYLSLLCSQGTAMATRVSMITVEREETPAEANTYT